MLDELALCLAVTLSKHLLQLPPLCLEVVRHVLVREPLRIVDRDLTHHVVRGDLPFHQPESSESLRCAGLSEHEVLVTLEVMCCMTSAWIDVCCLVEGIFATFDEGSSVVTAHNDVDFRL